MEVASAVSTAVTNGVGNVKSGTALATSLESIRSAASMTIAQKTDV